MARLRRTDEPQNLAWDVHRDSWRPGEDANGDEDSPNPAIIIPRRVNGQIVGYECDGKFSGFYVEGEGIEPGSACERAGCSEDDGDHACGGPDCAFVLPRESLYEVAGYNGWRISVEEMRIMTCVQVAMTEFGSEKWHPEEDDDEFESRDVLLTAVSESAPDEFDVNHVPYRHGIGGTVLIDDSGLLSDDTWGVPFHGPCYLVMKKVARKLGISREINLLARMISRRNDSFPPVSSSPDVAECDGQFWDHVAGTEYLAADPWHAPGLDKILEECVKSEPVWPEVYSIKSCEQHGSADNEASTVKHDPFLTLPPELRLTLLDHLEYKEIAALRQVTRAYKILPQTFFRDMIVACMPWVWEVHELEVQDNKVDWFELWSKLSRADGGVGKGPDRKSFKLEKPEGGLGLRVNGLVNRRRVWSEAEYLLEDLVRMQVPSLANSESES